MGSIRKGIILLVQVARKIEIEEVHISGQRKRRYSSHIVVHSIEINRWYRPSLFIFSNVSDDFRNFIQKKMFKKYDYLIN